MIEPVLESIFGLYAEESFRHRPRPAKACGRFDFFTECLEAATLQNVIFT
jgi:hypothetical protein